MIKSMIIKMFDNIWPMLLVFTVAISLIRFFYLQNHREKFHLYKELSKLISIIYIWLLFTLLTFTDLNVNSGINIIPFSEILRYEIGTKMFYYNVIGNIIIFIPFGYLISSYINPKRIWGIIITSLGTSSIVEFVQLQIGRSFDIDDIILNIVGAIIGYLLYKLLHNLYKHLPDICKKEGFKNIICIVIILLIIIYAFGWWGVVFK